MSAAKCKASIDIARGIATHSYVYARLQIRVFDHTAELQSFYCVRDEGATRKEKACENHSDATVNL